MVTTNRYKFVNWPVWTEKRLPFVLSDGPRLTARCDLSVKKAVLTEIERICVKILIIAFTGSVVYVVFLDYSRVSKLYKTDFWFLFIFCHINLNLKLFIQWYCGRHFERSVTSQLGFPCGVSLNAFTCDLYKLCLSFKSAAWISWRDVQWDINQHGCGVQGF